MKLINLALALTFSAIATIVYLALIWFGMSLVEVSYDDGQRPKYDNVKPVR